MKTGKVLLALLMVFFLAEGCKKDEKTKTELLTQHTWIMISATVDPSIPITNDEGVIVGYTENLYNQLDSCIIDNTILYYATGNVRYDEGASKCYEYGPQFQIYDWVFNADETSITETDVHGNTYDYNIIKLDENSMTQSDTQKLGDVNYTITIGYEPL
jgi:hypothetical protein